MMKKNNVDYRNKKREKHGGTINGNRSMAMSFKRTWPLYVMVIPGVTFLVMFKLLPILTSVIAFQDYSIVKGIVDSPWVGLKHFKTLFEHHDVSRVFTNTVVLASYNLIFIFPIPIIFALMLNELRVGKFKGFVQTVSYLPYLLSWVIVASLTREILASEGLYNSIRELLGLNRFLMLQDENYIRGIIVTTSIWKETGWNSIVILAAIAGISPDYYEAALLDGASKTQQIRHITLPLLMPTIVVLFLIKVGSFLDLGLDQIYNFLTPMTLSKGDVIATYVYRVGVHQGQYSFTTAVGLLLSVIGLVLVVLCNKLSKKLTGGGLW